MSIANKILEMCHEHVRRTGRYPDILWLNEKAIRELRDELAMRDDLYKAWSFDGENDKFMGIKIEQIPEHSIVKVGNE